MSTFTAEEIIGTDKALEFKLKFYGMEYQKEGKKDGEQVSAKPKGNNKTPSTKAINKIINGEPIKDFEVFKRLMSIKDEENKEKKK